MDSSSITVYMMVGLLFLCDVNESLTQQLGYFKPLCHVSTLKNNAQDLCMSVGIILKSNWLHGLRQKKYFVFKKQLFLIFSFMDPWLLRDGQNDTQIGRSITLNSADGHKVRWYRNLQHSRGRSHPPATFNGSSAIEVFAARDALSIIYSTLNVNFFHLNISMFLWWKLSVLMDLSPCWLLRMTFLMVVT